ncbi:GTP pyrophosphokinase family protein [Komagataeibacter sp. FNDCF1]|uniref:GTP pyrophosphokinase n=1 Tax=Komagataeibacter sp. FNDCF1 TaxID=2878681 RepID=UPI001E497EF7|nr:RelA/SpoT domain-containing protein [Komagataeibacter sp. FNDCF1]MCE2563803.1 RelA/SpoT domain-containing protein [Komagataeibacter sp. FNDCF1]
MTPEQAFLSRWHKEKQAYLAWGKCISKQVSAVLEQQIAPITVSHFLKAPPIPRLKEDLRLVEKAFYRKKNYHDPYVDITDKVGTRFIVLLGREIQLVANVLERIKGWTWSRDRDYEEEQSRNPIAFDYAAVHYVVRPSEDISVDDILIPANTPCEVQIKTILQHAYSELTHDTIYKPQIKATTAMQRNAAKAMALLEATNDYFEDVADQVEAALSGVREMTQSLSQVYRTATGLEPRPSLLEGLLLEAYEKGNIFDVDCSAQVQQMLTERPFIIDRIKERVARSNPLFSQPSILLAYLDIVERGRRALRTWPLTPDEMEPLLNDLGESRY